MLEKIPRLDQSALVRLRGLVRALHEDNNRSVPMKQLLLLARAAGLGANVTIDFEAARELGQPLVVLRYASDVRPPRCLACLSRRERQIAALVAEGLTNKQIGRRLFISLATVKDHVHHILVKSGLPNRAAVASAWKSSPKHTS